jgi:hypothetical protein
MFGINDNDQNSNQAAANPTQGEPLPPSPFMDPPASAPSAPVATTPASDSSTPPLPPSVPAADDGLVNLKQQALNNLAPLVNHLDQSPEEKFKTTMMLIQASDNSSLIKDAYEAANKITDEKARAQALLDVVNEINYFTQKDKPQA